jgi:hypothetical protein
MVPEVSEHRSWRTEPVAAALNRGYDRVPIWRLQVAEGEGFEPSIRFRIHAFQACALGQTMRPLQRTEW